MGSASSRCRRGQPLPPVVGLQLTPVLLEGPDPPLHRFLDPFEEGLPAAAPPLPADAQDAPPPAVPSPVLTGAAHAFFEAGIPAHPWDADQPPLFVPYNISAEGGEGRVVVRKYLFRPIFDFWLLREAISRIGVVRRPEPDDEEEDCLVCIDKFHGELLRRLPCDHLFHCRCIDHYFFRGGMEWMEDGPVCPLCRAVFQLL